ncbi:hypothetical protein BHM03_00004445 [Ensete ventricosum]|nr:hypothetical protein BHM03_00004445 [Ensete ventricosum]
MPLSSSQLFRSILRILHSSSSSSSLEPTSLPILRPHPHPCLVVNRCATSAYSHTAAPWCLRKEIDENPGSGTDVKKPCRIDSISSGVYLCTFFCSSSLIFLHHCASSVEYLGGGALMGTCRSRALAGRGGSQSDPSGYALYPFKVLAGATVRVVDEPTLKRPAVESMPCAEDPAHLEKPGEGLEELIPYLERWDDNYRFREGGSYALLSEVVIDWATKAIVWARYPDLKIKEDPFIIRLEEDSVPMENEQPFNDSVPPEL